MEAVWGIVGVYGASQGRMGTQGATWAFNRGTWGILGVYGGSGAHLRLYRGTSAFWGCMGWYMGHPGDAGGHPGLYGEPWGHGAPRGCLGQSQGSMG